MVFYRPCSEVKVSIFSQFFYRLVPLFSLTFKIRRDVLNTEDVERGEKMFPTTPSGLTLTPKGLGNYKFIP